jgi:ABC-type bacteriocin/lantibiotic exporter with double-glycine peptidase domain
VLELTPAADFRPRVERQSVTLRQLLGRVTGLKRSLLQIFALAVALEAFMLLSPFFMQWVVDSVLVTADRDLLVTLGLGFGCWCSSRWPPARSARGRCCTCRPRSTCSGSPTCSRT